MKTVLIIDDNEAFRCLLAEFFSHRGFCPIAAESGGEGFEKAQAHRPDIIFCDVNMPEKNGFEVLKLIRHNEQTAKIPFFLMTAEPHMNNQQQAEADGLIKKPIDLDELNEILVSCPYPLKG
ncbi:MAG: response regulator [Synechococcales bacterium]|nr:response regulator [Synechococcales bacterium]